MHIHDGTHTRSNDSVGWGVLPGAGALKGVGWGGGFKAREVLRGRMQDSGETPDLFSRKARKNGPMFVFGSWQKA